MQLSYLSVLCYRFEDEATERVSRENGVDRTSDLQRLFLHPFLQPPLLQGISFGQAPRESTGPGVDSGGVILVLLFLI